MPTDTIAQLVARVEGASGPDRELDCAVGVAVGRFFTLPNKGWPDRLDYIERRGGADTYPGNGFDQLVPLYTASLDAAMTLRPEGWVIRLTIDLDGGIVRLVDDRVHPVRLDDIEINAATPALALVAACLRAHDGGSNAG